MQQTGLPLIPVVVNSFANYCHYQSHFNFDGSNYVYLFQKQFMHFSSKSHRFEHFQLFILRLLGYLQYFN